MRYLGPVCVALALASCASATSNASQEAVVESEAARQTAVNAVAAGDSVDRALEKAATAPLASEKPKR